MALNAVLDVTDRQLCLQEQVELAVGQTHCGVHHSVRTKVQIIKLCDSKLFFSPSLFLKE